MQTQKYIEIKFEDGGTCVCADRDEVDAITEGYGPNAFTLREIEMTQEQYEALPDFEG